ncbi:uncharacterized protein DS421_18g613930 [Arachis hypogaea]|nr:uncharacterized protein DS421_18g613930 [Arachis hypogaea]
MRKKLATRRSSRTPIVKNPPSSSAPQSHTHIHIHPNSSSLPSSHSTASMACKTIHARASARQEAGSSKKTTNGQEQVPEEEEEESLPSPQPSPPRCSTPHPSSRSQKSKKPVLHNIREPSNLDSLDFKNKLSLASLGYEDEGARAYMSGKWDSHVGVSLQVALSRVCENFSALDGTTLTHKALEPVRALLHRIINHILMPQSGSYQRVTVCDTLVLFSILTSATISFSYLMVRHINEPVENRVSTIKGGSVPKSMKGKKDKSSMAYMLSDSESDNRPPESSKLSESIKDVMNEFLNMSNMMVKTYKEARNKHMKMRRPGPSAIGKGHGSFRWRR